MDSLFSSRKTGNLLLQTQCLTYLTVVERRRGNLKQVSELARESLDAAQTCQRADYVGVALANQAWLAWRNTDLEQASALSQMALENWNTGNPSYPVQWLGIWPLLGVCLKTGDVDGGVNLARRVMDAGQQRLDRELEIALTQTIQAWEDGDREIAGKRLQEALDMAQALSYL